MQLSKKQKTVCEFFAIVLNSTSTFKQFEKMPILIAYLPPKLQTPKELVRPMSKNPVTQHHWRVILLKISKNLRNLHDTSCIIFFIILGKIGLENVSVNYT